MRKLTVLYPFMEDGFSEDVAPFIETISGLKESKAIDVVITADKAGRSSDALKKAGLPYEEVAFPKPVGPNDCYPVALFKLIRSSFFSFSCFRTHKIDVMHCPDVLSLLCWGNAAKMNRIPFITSIRETGKFSRYARLMMADSRKLVCLNEDVRNKLPPHFSAISLLDPLSQNISENQTAGTAQKYAADFWIQLYASLFIKPDLSKITGILNKN